MRRMLAVMVLAVVATSCANGGSSSTTGGNKRGFPAALTAGRYRPSIDRNQFSAVIDNQYLPLKPGTTYRYKGNSDGEPETNIIRVTHRTKTIMGVRCVVVRDEVRANGELAELTYDWYAQDSAGNVWYFGEDSREYEGGKLRSHHGSWQAGVKGAQPGVVMPGHPEIGLAYRQEFLKGEAEDIAKVLSLDAITRVPYGSFRDVLVTEDRNPLEPKVIEHKYYARGIGVVLEQRIRGGREVNRLMSVKH